MTTLPAWLRSALARYPRIAIAGGPKTGKSSAANLVTDRHILHTDDLIAAGWENVPFIIQQRLRGKASFVVEGVQVPRALRKGLVVDAVVWMTTPKAPLTPGQAVMAKATATVFQEWRSISDGRVPVIMEPQGAAGGAA